MTDPLNPSNEEPAEGPRDSGSPSLSGTMVMRRLFL